MQSVSRSPVAVAPRRRLVPVVAVLGSVSLLGLATLSPAADSADSPVGATPSREDSEQPDRRSAGADGGVAGACTVTWPVFATTAVPLNLPDSIGLCSGDDAMGNVSVDLDGDGINELLRADDWEPGYTGDRSVRCLRRLGGVLRDEMLLSWDPSETTFPWIPSDMLDSFSVLPVGLFDCDGDGQSDLVIRTIWYSGAALVVNYGYFRNLLPPPQARSAADINRDGVVNGADLTMLLVAWAQGA